MKKILSVFLCGIILLCFVACGEKTNTDKQSAEGANQSENNSTENSITNTQPNKITNQSDTDNSENSYIEPTESTNPNDINNQATSIFNTKNIKRITFYAYYGNGKGSDVPGEHLDEFITWLNSFVIDKEVPELLPPGTNTIKIEIEYFDGTIVKKGLDTTTVDGITYYIKGDTAPECYEEIISKTSLN